MATIPIPALHAEPVFNVAGVPITNSIIGSWVAMVLLAVFLFVAARRPKLVPQGAQNILELAMEQFHSLVSDVLEDEKRTKKFAPIVLAVFLYFLFLNWIGLIPGFGTIGGHDAAGQFVPLLRAGSSDLNTTISVAILSFFTAQFMGMISVGVFRYAGKFIDLASPFKRPFHVKNILLWVPRFLLGLIELISELAKVVSLSFRLFGNVYAGEVLLVVFGSLLPLFVPLSGPFYLLEIFVGLLQAFVFAMLSIVFIKIATIDPQH